MFCLVLAMMFVRFFSLIGAFFLLSSQVLAASRELPVSADGCAIHFALTGQVGAGCVPPARAELGAERRLPPAGFDTAAASLDSVPEEQGYFIRFPFNSDDLTEEYKAHLARLGRVLNAPKLAQSCIKLVGHADSVGGPAYNRRLSDARARAVAAALASASQVDMGRIATEARGETALLRGIPGPHPLNRRVEILARPSNGTRCK
ncbi:OmpA family protein [Shimia sp.]|uniref:OmpA family protein n=1 Tax=Shimia sp. TaxID=1954381 RepID=UPI003BAB92FD